VEGSWFLAHAERSASVRESVASWRFYRDLRRVLQCPEIWRAATYPNNNSLFSAFSFPSN
jgi:hypothetical protein